MGGLAWQHGQETGKEENGKEEASGKEKARQDDSQKAGKEEAMTAGPRGKRTKDPRGGLTAAGRAAFRRKEGARLKPGVKKKVSEMTPQELRRKGSWAVRFYGRKRLPPLVGKDGKPTRHALSAHAWGEPVPRTATAARRIAARGRRLLARYRALKSKRR